MELDERNLMRFDWEIGTVCIGLGGVIVVVDRGSKIETKIGLCNSPRQVF